jgi:serine/alanine adding enzyme
VKIIRITSVGNDFRSFEQFFSTHPEAHFFQSGYFFKFIEGLKNYSPLLLICKDETGVIKGSLLGVHQAESNLFLRFFSSGIIIRGGPLLDPASDDQENILSDLLRYLINLTKNRARIIQFRNFSDQERFRPVFEKFRFTFADHQNLLTPTISKEQAWHQLKQNRKRQIRKSLENGATILADPSLEHFREFYDILFHLYRTRIFKPLPSWSFFERFYHEIFKSSNGIIHLVSYNEKIIGGIVCPLSPGKMVHEWYVCGLDRTYRPMDIYPSVLATWSAIESAANQGVPAFDFLGLGKPDTYYGVRDFKLRFGGILVNYGRYERINNRLVYLITKTGYSTLSSLHRWRFSKD